MGLGPTHGYESSVLAPTDSKRVIRDFRGSAIGWLQAIFWQTGPAREDPNGLM